MPALVSRRELLIFEEQHEDVRLATRSISADRQAICERAQRARPELVAFGSWFRDGYMAEKVAQETLVRAYGHISSLRNPAAFHGWLMTIARNVARDCWRLHHQPETVSLAAIPQLPPVPDLADDLAANDALRCARHQPAEGSGPEGAGGLGPPERPSARAECGAVPSIRLPHLRRVETQQTSYPPPETR